MTQTVIETLSNFYGGEHQPPVGGGTMPVINPATGEEYASAPLSDAADVDAACRAAADAFPGWRDATPSERSLALLRIADALEANAEELTRIEVENTGKPYGLTLSEEIPPAADQVRFFAGAARHLEGLSAGEYMRDHTSMIRREPLGVCAQVAPWNYPLMMAVWKFAPALAAGNTVVLKPSDTTPASSLKLAELAAEFLPPGVLNVIAGDRDTGRALVSHPIPSLVSVTGSIRAGKEVATAASSDLKRVHLELGGKAPVIVFDDADAEAAAEGIAGAGYFNAGQDCTAASRVLVGSRVHDEFVSALAERAKGTTTGDPYDDGTDYGPLNNPDQLDRVSGLRARSRAHRSRRRWQPSRPGRLVLRADRPQWAHPGGRNEPRGDLWPGHHGAAFRRRAGGAGLGQRCQVRARLQCLDHGPRPGDAHGQVPRLRSGVDQYPHPVGG